MNKVILETNRLRLRQWKISDLAPFAEMNASPKVMKYYPHTLNKMESDVMAKKIKKLIFQQGWGLWAVERKDNNTFIGFVGLHKTKHELPCTLPCIEIGWRLADKYWGKGYATEAAHKALAFAFIQLNLEAIYSFTSVINQKSEAIMKRIGMINLHQNFEHPMLPKDSHLQKHVVYKILRKDYINQKYQENFNNANTI
jgi:ribosomal-protein-alanine N-acetyltransferase